MAKLTYASSKLEDSEVQSLRSDRHRGPLFPWFVAAFSIHQDKQTYWTERDATKNHGERPDIA